MICPKLAKIIGLGSSDPSFLATFWYFFQSVLAGFWVDLRWFGKPRRYLTQDCQIRADLARFLSPLIEAFCLHKKHKFTKVSPIENQVFVKIRIRNEISSYFKADWNSAKSVRIWVLARFCKFWWKNVRFTTSQEKIKIFTGFSMLVKVLCDQNELRTTQNPARTAFQKYQKATKK